MVFRLLIIKLVVFPISIFSQSNSIIESNEFEEISTEHLMYLENTNRVLNINEATYEEFSLINILNESHIKSIIEYRDQYGPFMSIHELQVIEGFDTDLVKDLGNLLKIEKQHHTGLLRKIFHPENNYILYRYEFNRDLKKGEINDKFRGRDDKARFRFHSAISNDFSIGINAEKDAGEQFNFKPDNHQYGFDFYSFHFSLYNRSWLKSITIGDYQIQQGESLIFGSGLNLGKNYETILTVKKAFNGFQPYRSVGESAFYRGVAVELEPEENWLISLFGSYDLKDATLRNEGGETVFSSVIPSGLHRTQTELRKKNNLSQLDFGGIVHYSGNSLNTGVGFLQTRFSQTVKKAGHIRNLYAFSGKNNTVMSVFFDKILGNTMFFGEYALSNFNSFGGVSGVMVNLSAYIQFSLLLRYYQPSFSSLYSGSFRESSVSSNEWGEYLGLYIRPPGRNKIAVYFDRFYFPWVRFQIDAPSKGYEYMINVDHKIRKGASIRIKFREESKKKNTENGYLNSIETRQKYNYLFNVNCELNKVIELRSRAQGSITRFGASTTKGFLLSQDIIIKYRSLAFSARVMLFETDDYENRQFIYERDLLYSFSIPFFQNEGTRSYLLVKYKVNRKIDFWIRWSKTDYRGVDQIGSGLNTIEGNTKTDIKCQVKIQI